MIFAQTRPLMDLKCFKTDLIPISKQFPHYNFILVFNPIVSCRFLFYMSVQRAKLQLVRTACMVIASKYEEIYPQQHRREDPAPRHEPGRAVPHGRRELHSLPSLLGGRCQPCPGQTHHGSRGLARQHDWVQRDRHVRVAGVPLGRSRCLCASRRQAVMEKYKSSKKAIILIDFVKKFFILFKNSHGLNSLICFKPLIDFVSKLMVLGQ